MFEERVQKMRQRLQEVHQESSQQSAAARQDTCLTVEAARFNDENTVKGFTATVTQ